MEHPRSVWLTTARAAPPLPQLDGDVETEVAIVGAGYTGLCAAHHLARAGVACLVLEANDVGWGASGRNGGMAVLRYKKSWTTLAQRFGNDIARHLHCLLHHAVELMEEVVLEYGIRGFSRCGHITAANGTSALAALEADVRWLAAEAADTGPRMLGRDETAALTGTTEYLGGYLDPRAAGIHPLDYVRGLAAGLTRRGVPIVISTPVESLREEPGAATLGTARGRVKAKQVLLATNAYTELYRYDTNLRRRVVPVSTSVITTAPLPDARLEGILPQRHLVSDTRHLLNYFRLAPGNRLLYGGRASLTGKESVEVYRGLERKLARAFPTLADAPIDHRWSGKVAVTLDDFPHVGRVSPRVAYAMGYGGRGVALTQLLGKMLAQLARGERIDAGPMSARAFRPIPLHALRIPGMKAVAAYYGVLDALKV